MLFRSVVRIAEILRHVAIHQQLAGDQSQPLFGRGREQRIDRLRMHARHHQRRGRAVAQQFLDEHPGELVRVRRIGEGAFGRIGVGLQPVEQAMQALAAWTGQNVPAGGWRAEGAWPQAGTATHPIDIEALVEQRPDVVAARERLASADAALQGAQALNRADPTLGATFDHYPTGEKTERLLGVRISIPINGFSRFEGEIGRALAQKDLAQDLLDKTRIQARAELHSLLQAWQSESARLQSYESRIMPQAQQVAAQAELAYSKGGLSLTDLLDARRTLRATQLEASGVRNDHAHALGAWQLRTAP